MCATNLSKQLLVVKDDRNLEVNFDPELLEISEETRYMTNTKRAGIPEIVLNLYEKNQYYFRIKYYLDLVVKWLVFLIVSV